MAFLAMTDSLGLTSQIHQMKIRQQELQDVQNTYTLYSIMFDEICQLKKGDKLARDSSGVYYRHVSGEYFIQLRRWWTNQGREHTFIHLDEDFTTFMKYLDKVLNLLSITYDERYRELGRNLKDLANSLMTGLYTLKSTYPEEKKLICKIDSIILSLIDFKNSVGEKLTMSFPVTTKRQRAFSD